MQLLMYSKVDSDHETELSEHSVPERKGTVESDSVNGIYAAAIHLLGNLSENRPVTDE